MMRYTLAKVWALFAPAEKRKAVVMLLLVILMALAETLGVLSIMPFLSVLARPGIVGEHPVLQAIYQYSGAADVRGFIVMLGLVILQFGVTETKKKLQII